ncbi:hypothetical protein FNV43_RR10537 [Rhamnella rubrinervis]|uniref:ADP-ribosyl cyclase/cyclic ADP-ribose hydrolase n=1 Tax=Rhamnella rubrinervis TaxID=2594499 RepID=A0A8K0H450_9ROSA|nr:hypothetical protein FNV43_RR10537 [Rhamnella rubrinervis]
MSVSTATRELEFALINSFRSFMASSPFYSAVSTQEKRYDVFLSFRGEDTGDRFASYLYAALYDKQILCFMDRKLERGDEISPTLRKTIDESTISVIIFSENYATSTWCLDELVQILEAKKRNGQIVMPIFYGIDPSIVRRQKGCYEVAFAALEQRFKNRMETVHQWRAALTEAANLCGLDSKDFRPENQLIQKIVRDVLLKLPKYSSCNIDGCKGRLFAIQERMEEIENLLDIGSTNVRILGIWGMGGIGKTTIASVVFQRFAYSHFEGRSYLWNVRQEYESFGPNYLRRKLLIDLLKDEATVSMDTPFVASPFIQDRLCRKRVLIVLDDVDSSVQLETLVEGYHQLAPGSRIIVTTRDKQVLVKVADGIHKVEGLNYIESLKLFHLHAFGKNSIAVDCETLSERVASYANGNPLTLRVLGSFLHSRSKEEWESALEKLKRVPNKDILKVLRISYDGLDDKGIQNIFLDIACFFDRPFTREYAESILGGGDSSVTIGISVLIDKSLIENCRENKKRFRMHDLVRQMGWSVVSDEHKEPGNRSRLCNATDVCHVLEKNTGTAAIEGILLNLSEVKRDVKISPAAFSKMCNLRFLKIYCDNIQSNKCKLYLPRGFESIVSNELRYFQCDLYPSKYLPEFSPENLVELILRHSHLEQLGNHVVQSLPKLQNMDLSNSKFLTHLPDLSLAPNLESINLEGCRSLFHILSSIENLHKLIDLNLNGCSNLRDLEEISGRRGYLGLVRHKYFKNLVNNTYDLLKYLTFLNPSIANFITKFPLQSSRSSISQRFPLNLRSLRLGGTSIEVLPSSICDLPGLDHLDLSGCKRLKSLPTSICKLKSLQSINLNECSNLEEFPEILEPMERLYYLDLVEAAIKNLPESIENLVGLRDLRIRNCREIEFLPNNLCNLRGLDNLYLDNCPKLQTLPSCPLGLELLSIRNCASFSLTTELPSCLGLFNASNCTSLESIPSWTSSPRIYRMKVLEWWGVIHLDSTNHGAVFTMLSCAMLWNLECFDQFEVVGMVHGFYPGDEIPKLFSYQSLGNSLRNIKLPDWNSNDLLGVVFCVVLEPSKIVDHHFVYVHYQSHDEHAYKYDGYAYLGELEIKSDHILMWYDKKYLKGRSWFNTCSNVTELSFHVKTYLYDGGVKFVGSGSENLKIKKCGIQLVYSEASGNGVRSQDDEEKDHDDESHPYE